MIALLSAALGKFVSRQASEKFAQRGSVGRPKPVPPSCSGVFSAVTTVKYSGHQHGEGEHGHERGEPPVDRVGSRPRLADAASSPVTALGSSASAVVAVQDRAERTSERAPPGAAGSRSWTIEKTTITMKKMTALAIW